MGCCVVDGDLVERIASRLGGISLSMGLDDEDEALLWDYVAECFSKKVPVDGVVKRVLQEQRQTDPVLYEATVAYQSAVRRWKIGSKRRVIKLNLLSGGSLGQAYSDVMRAVDPQIAQREKIESGSASFSARRKTVSVMLNPIADLVDLISE